MRSCRFAYSANPYLFNSDDNLPEGGRGRSETGAGFQRGVCGTRRVPGT